MSLAYSVSLSLTYTLGSRLCHPGEQHVLLAYSVMGRDVCCAPSLSRPYAETSSFPSEVTFIRKLSFEKQGPRERDVCYAPSLSGSHGTAGT